MAWLARSEIAAWPTARVVTDITMFGHRGIRVHGLLLSILLLRAVDVTQERRRGLREAVYTTCLRPAVIVSSTSRD